MIKSLSQVNYSWPKSEFNHYFRGFNKELYLGLGKSDIQRVDNLI